MKPAADRVPGHARGGAREQACPKRECIWTRNQSFPFPDHEAEHIVIDLTPITPVTQSSISPFLFSNQNNFIYFYEI